MASFKVAAKNAEDARAQAIAMQKAVNVSLKENVIEQDEDERGYGGCLHGLSRGGQACSWRVHGFL